jgi:hypothetical protein
MSEQDETEVRFEGIVRASCYLPALQGKQFLGAIIECADGREWVIDYDEQSPFHAFADRHVVVSGRPYTPEGQRIGGDQIVGHFRVSTMRLVEVTPEAEFVEVGPAHHLSGRFERGTSDTGEATLSFVSANGDTFLVTNDPAGAAIGRSGDVLAYAVEPSPSSPSPPAQYLWIICPCSPADLWEWRERRS